jgi:transcriptional regulator with XRE-family HTH domain
MIALEMTHSTIDIDGLGKRVRQIRDALGMSQWDLAVKANIPQSTIHKIEVGKTTAPRVDTLEAIAEALGTSLRTLLWKEGEGIDDGEPRDPVLDLFEELAPGVPIQRLKRYVRLFGMIPPDRQESAGKILEVLVATLARPGDSALPIGDGGENESRRSGNDK